MNEKIFYIHNFNRKQNYPNNDGTAFCVAYRVIDNHNIEIGVSWSQDQYVKKIGREIATKRLEEQPIIVNISTLMKEFMVQQGFFYPERICDVYEIPFPVFVNIVRKNMLNKMVKQHVLTNKNTLKYVYKENI